MMLLGYVDGHDVGNNNKEHSKQEDGEGEGNKESKGSESSQGGDRGDGGGCQTVIR